MATPPTQPTGTQISFDQDSGPSAPTVHGIFIANADGSDPRRVTTGIRTPRPSTPNPNGLPNSKRLAFMSVKNGKQAAIFVVNIDGTGLKRLTPWSLDAGNPDWSPDGREILFNPYWDPHPGKFSNIFSMRPDGSHRTLLTSTRGQTAVIQAVLGSRRQQSRLHPLHPSRKDRPARPLHHEPQRDGPQATHQHAQSVPEQRGLGNRAIEQATAREPEHHRHHASQPRGRRAKTADKRGQRLTRATVTDPVALTSAGLIARVSRENNISKAANGWSSISSRVMISSANSGSSPSALCADPSEPASTIRTAPGPPGE